MKKDGRGQNREKIRILLVGVGREEREALASYLAAREPGTRLLPVSRPIDAVPCLEAQQADAILCEWSAFEPLRQALAEDAEACAVPILVLVPPGAEEPAAALLEGDWADFVVREGNYPLWLLTRLRRALHRQETSWEEIARVIRHELNNPLTGVLGNAELIQVEGQGLSEKVRQRLTTIIELAVRLRDVVSNLEGELRRRGAVRPGSPRRGPARRSLVDSEVLR